MSAPRDNRRNPLVLAVPTAVPVALMSLAGAVSYAQILTSSAAGNLSGGYLTTAAFFSMAGEAFGTRLASHCPFTMSGPEMTATLFLGRMLHAVAEADLGEAARPTACVAMHAGTMILGLTYVLLGKVRAVAALNYLPYPVVAGFLAMIGAAVVKAALGLLHTTDGQTALSLPIGVSMALIALVLKLKGVPSNFSSVAMITLSLLIFYGWAFWTHAPLESLRDEGWLLPAGSGAVGPFDIFKVDLSMANYNYAIPSVHALALLFVASIMRALTLTSIESAAAITPYSVEDEMTYLGWVTVCMGCVGGVAMNASSGQTTLAKEGSQDDPHVARYATLTVALIELGVWMSGFPVTAFLPKFLLGALLLLMGGGMVVDWAWLVNRKLQWTGVLVIYGMLTVSLYADLTTGIGLGVVLAFVLTNVRFAQLEVLKYHVSGVHFRSGQIYDSRQRDVLRTYGSKIQIVGLTGYLFEGVAISLVKYLKEVVRTTKGLDTLILDFFACQGMNDSACAHLIRLAKLLASRHVTLFLCNASADDARLLRSWKIESQFCQILDNFTDAVTKAESKVLACHGAAVETIRAQTQSGEPEREALSCWLGEKATTALLSLGKLITISEGSTWGAEGQMMDSIFIAVPGFSDVQLEMHMGGRVRPAVSMRTTKGAVCPAEALLRSCSRGTWRVQSRSVGVRVDDLDSLVAAGDAFAPLLAAGLHQEFSQKEFLSSRFTVLRGGGWHGVTFDASTTLGADEKMAGATCTRKDIAGLRPRQRSVDWEEAMRSVAAVIQPQASRDATLPSELFAQSDNQEDLQNLVLNRETMKGSSALFAVTGQAPPSASPAHCVDSLFTGNDEKPHTLQEASRPPESLRQPLVTVAPVLRPRSYSDTLKSALLTGETNPLDMDLTVLSPKRADGVDATL